MSGVALSDDDLVFAEEGIEPIEQEKANGKPWKVIITDDEEMIHQVTELALKGFSFEDKGLKFLHAYSGAEAMDLVRDNPDTALMLLDVVMESDDAGLKVAKAIREELENHNIRIVLRTGQPGQAPEHKVIAEYDINDYKEKTEITSQKLDTMMYSALRSYRDILSLEESRKGLAMVIESTATISEPQSLEKFTKGVLKQLTALLNLEEGAVYSHRGGLAASLENNVLSIIAGTGEYENLAGADAREVLENELLESVETALSEKHNLQNKNDFIAYFESKEGSENIACVRGGRPLRDLEKGLLEIFCRNVSIAFDNLYLRRDIESTQREIVYRLSEAVETRSKETGNHVKRVAEYSKLLALGLGMDEDEAELIHLGSPLHDVGKIGIPDAILNKPGKHTPEEWEIMKTHAMLGHDMLKGSNREILRAGARIARDHHEKWDGSGYPYGRKGQEIHIYGRIVALADVFDALGSDRCYKKAWEYGRIVDYLNEMKGTQFDPALVGIFLDHEDKFLNIRDFYQD